MVVEDLKFTADRVYRLRILLGETQEEFAQRLGVAKAAVTRWEGGNHLPMAPRAIRALITAERELVLREQALARELARRTADA